VVSGSSLDLSAAAAAHRRRLIGELNRGVGQQACLDELGLGDSDPFVDRLEARVVEQRDLDGLVEAELVLEHVANPGVHRLVGIAAGAPPDVQSRSLGDAALDRVEPGLGLERRTTGQQAGQQQMTRDKGFDQCGSHWPLFWPVGDGISSIVQIGHRPGWG
jgi:hypothetical protein